MILQSWSLFIEKTEKNYLNSENYIDYLNSKCDKLYKLILTYLPESKNPLDYEIVPTFIHIFNSIREKYDGSGAKINVLDGNQQEQTFIQDPELKYIKKKPHHHFSILSITERIDDIFNLICQKINDVLGSKIGLRLFMRRTFGGCEFGICYDFNIENRDSEILKDLNCIVDKDPLLLFTINVKSLVPVLAGILIIGLVYIASIAKSISEWIMTFPAKFTKELVVKSVKTVAKLVVNKEIEKVCDAVISFLQKQVEKQIDQLKLHNSKYADIFMLLLKIAAPADFSTCGEYISELFEGKSIGFKSSFAAGLVEDLPIASFLKIGFLVMLCFATFMINFHDHKQSIKYNTEKAAANFDEVQDADLALRQNNGLIHCPCQPIEKIKVTFKSDNE